MSFAVVLFGIGLWEHLKQGRSISAGALIACGVVFFCTGAFQAWTKEREKADLLRGQLATDIPKLNLTALGGVNRYDSLSGHHVFIITLVLGNGGASTAVPSWHATYELGDSVEQMTSFKINNGFLVALTNDRKIFWEKEMMPSILAQARIERRTSIQGRILFAVQGDRTQQTLACQYRIRITCTDFDGRPCTCVYTPSAQSQDSILYFSHEESPFKHPELEARTDEN